MLISLNNLLKPFWLGKQMLTNGNDKNNHHTKNRFSTLTWYESVNIMSMIIFNSPMKKENWNKTNEINKS